MVVQVKFYWLVFAGLGLSSLLGGMRLSASLPDAGYVDTLGHYKWFVGKQDSTFVDSEGMKWSKWCSDSIRWASAIVIYRANITALTDIGYDSSYAQQLLALYDSEHPLFDRLSRCLEPNALVEGWRPSFNSAVWRWSARRKVLRSLPLSLKYYPEKGGSDGSHGVGLVRTALLGHIGEALRSLWSHFLVKWSELCPGVKSRSSFNAYLRNAQYYMAHGAP